MTKHRMLMAGARVPRTAIASNDDNPDRITRLVPHNGGCSTTSGMAAVTMPRIPTIDGYAKQVAA